MSKPKVMLAVEFSRPAGNNRITWKREYRDDGILTEVVTEIDHKGRTVEVWNNLFHHYFNWKEIKSVRADYARWRWTILG